MSAGDPRLYSDALGNRVPHDGRSPVTWRLASYALAVRDGAVLMIEPVWAERWELPGGEVEIGEPLLDGAIRECWEETGHRFVPATTDPFHVGEAFFHIPEAGTFHHSVLFYFQGSAEDGHDPSWQLDSREVRRVCWVDPTTLSPATTHGGHWAVLRKAGLVSS